MKVTRVYADEHGESHFADLDVALRDGGPIGHLSEEIPAKAVIFRRNDPGYDYDWHIAPRRQYIFVLSGAMEIGSGDGTMRRFGPGDVVLADDLTGTGDITRSVGVPRVSATVATAD